MSKLFGIGMSGTGTSSLAKALEILGYRNIKSWRVPLPFEEPFDSATHETASAWFEECDRLYPGSKFILTVREKKSWLNSIQRHLAVHNYRGIHVPWDREFFMKVYGSPGWRHSKRACWRAYENHLARVEAHFLERDDLLVFDVCGGEGWEKLCPFLEKDLPDAHFPRTNVGSSVWRLRLSPHGTALRKRLWRPARKLKKKIIRLAD